MTPTTQASRSERARIVRQYFQPRREKVDAPPVAVAAQQLLESGYDKLTIATLFLQAAAVLVPPTMTPREFAGLARESFEVTQARLDEFERQEGM